ncbi:MAG TPA: pseudaminic acid cytidylyltransferase [Moraxellaceae bacterium]
MKLAIIPARGGSKRIPRKNLKPFCGQPIMAWSIAAALQSSCFDEVMVSTDDEEIAALARRCGASTPFVRPAALADDYAGTAAVMRHAVAWYDEQGRRPEAACCIYATAPFIRAQDLRQGLAILQQQQSHYAFTVTSYPFPIQRSLRITARGRVEMLQPAHMHTRSQDLEEAFHDAGQFYWGTAEAWLDSQPIYGPDSVPLLLPRHRVQDIDTPEDWRRAELMFQALQAQPSDDTPLTGPTV